MDKSQSSRGQPPPLTGWTTLASVAASEHFLETFLLHLVDVVNLLLGLSSLCEILEMKKSNVRPRGASIFDVAFLAH